MITFASHSTNNVEDLAFLLVTHDFDAMPRGDYVEVRIDGSIIG